MRMLPVPDLGWTVALCLFCSVETSVLAGDAKLAGTWTWQWKDAENQTHKHVLDVEGEGASLAASERFDEEEAVKVTDLKLKGKKVTFSVMRGKRRSAYSGTLADNDTINGDVTVTVEGGPANEYGWTATREKPPSP